jgi:hypothetical protein
MTVSDDRPDEKSVAQRHRRRMMAETMVILALFI